MDRVIVSRARFAQVLALLGALTGLSNASAEPSAPVSTPEQPSDAAADGCIAQHRQAQVERSHGRLLAAHEQLRRCLLPACSPILREACATLLADIERDTPSVVLAAESPNGDLLNVTVEDAGKRIASRLDGVPIPLDPGEHQLEFRAAGMVPLNKVVVLRAGDRNRRIAVRLEPVALEISPHATLPPALPPNAPTTTRSHVWNYTLIGAGSAVGVAAIWMGASAMRDYRDAEDSCSPLCSEGRISAIHTKAIVADGLFVLSLATLSYGVFRILSTHDAPRATSVLLGPGSISARGRF
ncbi:MAG TPA: hypothetical protein VFQ61_36485 [Polyangiaceae bacterium]|nr:hypothetical protein [Polyangiaceae bacterium]